MYSVCILSSSNTRTAGSTLTNIFCISEGVMIRRKQPPSLEDTLHEKVCKMVRETGVKWTRRLRSALVTSRNTWLQAIKSVEEECLLVRENIAFLPVPFVSDLIVLYAVQEFAKLITLYHHYNRRYLITRNFERKIHEDICGNMLKAVLLPCISKCDIGIANSDFVKELLIKMLYVIPNIKTLILPALYHANYIQLFLQRIQILSELQEFQFHVGCTAEVIIELSKYCSGMKKISVQYSRRVDDQCVEHLLKLRHLLSLNIAETSISTNSYATLLLGLPEIRDVTWFRPVDPILRKVTVCLPSVTVFVGRISDATLLVQKCPNIRQLVLRSFSEDISDLGGLRHVVVVSISWCCCTLIRFSCVIRRLGTTLTNLEMQHVENINMDDLVNYCTVLNSLTLGYCHIMYTDTFDPELPHFRNLQKLRLRHTFGPFDFISTLHLYVNLNVLSIMGMAQVSDMFIETIVRAGGFRNVTEFVVAYCGYLSIDAAWLLMHNCPNLTTLGNIDSWPGVTSAQVLTLLNHIECNNLALTLCR
jgi:hypothetical protein